MQHCEHVAEYYWFKYKQRGEAWKANMNHHASQDYGFAAKDAKHAAKWFRH
jgi:hypothetical protein